VTPIRVLIVDDHNLFREGLQAIFLAVQDIEVVGEASSGLEAVEKARQFQPDVILMDIQMDDLNGVEACRQILAVQPDIGVIMLTMLEDTDSLFAAICAGAKGYVLKGADKAEVLKTIRAVAGGDVLFGSAIANRITGLFRNFGAARVKAHLPASFSDLTERENEILDLIAQGLNNQDIATRLGITGKTVSNHISNIFNKLQVADRAQAIVKAREAGLGHESNE
jgi:DNA-binding NarL/FixJ family response regulator